MPQWGSTSACPRLHPRPGTGPAVVLLAVLRGSSCAGHSPAGSATWARGGLEPPAPPPSPRSPGISRGQRELAAGSALGAEAGLFRGVWRGGCGLALSLPGDPTGTSAATEPGWSPGTRPVPAAGAQAPGAAGTGTPRWGGDAASLGPPPGLCGAAELGAWLLSKGLQCCRESARAGSPWGRCMGPAAGSAAGSRLRAQSLVPLPPRAGSCSVPVRSWPGWAVRAGVWLHRAPLAAVKGRLGTGHLPPRLQPWLLGHLGWVSPCALVIKHGVCY